MIAEFVVDALAVQRITRLVADDVILDGPRDELKRRLHARLSPDDWERVRYLMGCHWCLSIWIGVGVVAARRLCPRGWDPLARALAASSVAGLASTAIRPRM